MANLSLAHNDVKSRIQLYSGSVHEFGHWHSSCITKPMKRRVVRVAPVAPVAYVAYVAYLAPFAYVAPFARRPRSCGALHNELFRKSKNFAYVLPFYPIVSHKAEITRIWLADKHTIISHKLPKG